MTGKGAPRTRAEQIEHEAARNAGKAAALAAAEIFRRAIEQGLAVIRAQKLPPAGP